MNKLSLGDMIILILASILSISLLLGMEDSPLHIDKNFLWLAVFVVFMLFQSIFTKFCLMAIILKKIFPNIR